MAFLSGFPWFEPRELLIGSSIVTNVFSITLVVFLWISAIMLRHYKQYVFRLYWVGILIGTFNIFKAFNSFFGTLTEKVLRAFLMLDLVVIVEGTMIIAELSEFTHTKDVRVPAIVFCGCVLASQLLSGVLELWYWDALIEEVKPVLENDQNSDEENPK